MMLQVNQVGKYGIIKDIDGIQIPLEAWTDGSNIRFEQGEVKKILGETEAYDPTPTAVTFLMPVTHWSGGTPTQKWIYADEDKVYSYDGTTETNITRYTTTAGDNNYTGGTSDLWNGCMNQNVLALTNGVDSPQVWTGAVLTDMVWAGGDTWAEKGYSTKLLRSYKNFLFALQFNNGTTNNPNTVYWSEPAEPFAAPSTWDYSTGTNLSGQVELTNTSGYILDGKVLRDYFGIYKEDAIIMASYTGGQYVFAFRDLSNTTGALAQNCVQEFQGKHFIFARDDILVTDGNSIQSVINGWLRKKLFSEIDPTNYFRSYVIPYYNKSEMWCCYPTTGNTFPNRAMIWNWDNNTWTIRNLSTLRSAATGVLWSTSGATTWNSDTNSWDSDTSSWDERTYNPTVNKLLGTTGSKIILLDDSYTFSTIPYSSYVTKEWIKLGKSDTLHRVTAVYPKGTGEMNIYVGHAMHQSDPFTWEGPYNIDPSTDAQIRCRVTGRFHAIKFEFVGDVEHTLQGYDIEYVDTGYGR